MIHFSGKLLGVMRLVMSWPYFYYPKVVVHPKGWGNGAERPRLVQTQCWCPQGRWLLSPSGVCG